MNSNKIHHFETAKGIEKIIQDIGLAFSEKGFFFDRNNSLDMKKIYQGYNIDLPQDFDVRMMRICNPQRSSQALMKNPERGTVTPRFLTFFKKENKIQIRFLDMGAETITELLDDPDFSKGYAKFNQTIVEIIKKCLV